MKEYVSGPTARYILKCDKDTLNAILQEDEVEAFRKENGAWQIKRADLVKYAEEHADKIRSLIIKALFKDKGLIDTPTKYFKSHYTTLHTMAYGHIGFRKAAKFGLTHRSDFKKKFSSFYGMIGVYVTNDFKSEYFSRLNQILDCSQELNIDTLIEDADRIRCNRKIEFSFITKMYNLVDETKFPIYDKNVLSALKIKAANKDIRLYKENYLAIISTYESTRSIWEPVVKSFRKFFELEECQDISDWRILDILIWCIGGEK